MAEIRWTKEAHRWLKDIYDYIALDNIESAQEALELNRKDAITAAG